MITKMNGPMLNLSVLIVLCTGLLLQPVKTQFAWWKSPTKFPETIQEQTKNYPSLRRTAINKYQNENTVLRPLGTIKPITKFNNNNIKSFTNDQLLGDGQYLNVVNDQSPIIFTDNRHDLLVDDECILSYNGQTGICESARECPWAFKDTTRPDICAYLGTEAIICCPNQRVDNRDSVSQNRVSARKCEDYMKLATHKFSVIPLVINPPSYEISVPQCDYSSPLIVGGEITKPGEFPHMALIGWQQPNSREIEWNCGGVLISTEFILTAGHCASSFGTAPSVVRLGEQNIVRDDDNAEPQEIAIKEIIRHPEFKRPSVYNDIALIKLATKPKLGKFVRPACLWQTSEINSTKTVATGWGQIEYAGAKSDDLLKVVLDIYENSFCQQFFQPNRKLPTGIISSQLCAGYAQGGKDSCSGDSGGPIQVTTPANQCVFHIIGITSFGKSCGGANSPGVYTRVSSYLDWIESVVWPNN